MRLHTQFNVADVLDSRADLICPRRQQEHDHLDVRWFFEEAADLEDGLRELLSCAYQQDKQYLHL